jgi:hypothetical protein
MEVAFVRVPGRALCEGVVHRDDGRVFIVPNPGAFRRVPPHDVGQFAVEHALGWQTGFWGYVARGVVFPGMQQQRGARAPHGEERSRAAIRGAKDLLAEAESLAGAVEAIVRAKLNHDAQRMSALLADSWWPPCSRAAQLPVADVQRACGAFRQIERDWQALACGDSLRFRWSRRPGPQAPENPLDVAAAQRRACR